MCIDYMDIVLKLHFGDPIDYNALKGIFSKYLSGDYKLGSSPILSIEETQKLRYCDSE